MEESEGFKQLLKDVHTYKKILDGIFYGKHLLFKSFPKFLKQVRQEHPEESKLNYSVVKWYYDNQAIVQIFKPYEENHVRVPITTTSPFNRVYIDSMYLSLNNSTVAFINIMDLFSKYAYSNLFIIPKNTSAVKSIYALKTFDNFLEKIGNKKIGSVMCDVGSEFQGDFQKGLIEKKIPQTFADAGDKSATSPIERFNKTLRLSIAKYRMVYGKITQEALNTIIDSYNNSMHSTLKYSPNQIIESKELANEVYKNYDTMKAESKYTPRKGWVRIKLETNVFSKLKAVWSNELYEIESFKNGRYTLKGKSGKYRDEDLQFIQKEYLLNPKVKLIDIEGDEAEEVKPQRIPEVERVIEKRETRMKKNIDYNALADAEFNEDKALKEKEAHNKKREMQLKALGKKN